MIISGKIGFQYYKQTAQKHYLQRYPQQPRTVSSILIFNYKNINRKSNKLKIVRYYIVFRTKSCPFTEELNIQPSNIDGLVFNCTLFYILVNDQFQNNDSLQHECPCFSLELSPKSCWQSRSWRDSVDDGTAVVQQQKSPACSTVAYLTA